MKLVLLTLLAVIVISKVDISLYRNHKHNPNPTEVRLTEIKQYTGSKHD